MPLTTLPITDIIISLPGTFPINGIEYTRQITVLNLKVLFQSKQIITEGFMMFYNPDGTPVTGSLLITNYPVRMVASNANYCDMNGTTICSVADATNDPTLVDGKDYMTEFEWFFNVANTESVVMNQMIQQFYMSAIAAGRFN